MPIKAMSNTHVSDFQGYGTFCSNQGVSDAFQHVFSWLQPKEAARAAPTCSLFANIVKDDHSFLWQEEKSKMDKECRVLGAHPKEIYKTQAKEGIIDHSISAKTKRMFFSIVTTMRKNTTIKVAVLSGIFFCVLMASILIGSPFGGLGVTVGIIVGVILASLIVMYINETIVQGDY